MGCECRIAFTVIAARSYHRLLANLECAYLIHDLEAPLLLSARLERAFRDRNDAIAELTAATYSRTRSQQGGAIEQATERLGNGVLGKAGSSRVPIFRNA
jgi:hypothetical protein